MKKNVSPAVIVLVVAVVVIVIALIFYRGLSGKTREGVMNSLDKSEDVIVPADQGTGGETPAATEGENPLEGTDTGQ